VTPNELFANNFTTELAAPVAADDTVIQVTSPAPSSLQGTGEFRILVDGGRSQSEIMLASNVGAGTTWTVARGAATNESPIPTPMAHAAGASVSQILTEGGLEQALTNAGAGSAGIATETTRAEAAEAANASSVGSETARAEGAESAESTRAQTAEASKAASSALSSETSRAQAAEAAAAVAGMPAVVGAVTAAGALVVGKHTPVDATSGALTMTLPTGQAQGTRLSVEKFDSSANVVTVSGSLRGSASTLPLALAHESVLLETDAAGSWWPIGGHKTLSTLDSRYTLTGAAGPGQVPPLVVTATSVALGNVTGATALNLASGKAVQVTGVLTGNTVLNVTGVAAGSSAVLLLAQDATGGRTLQINDGSGAVAVTIPTTASATFGIELSSPDGTNLFVTPLSVPGPAGAVNAIVSPHSTVAVGGTPANPTLDVPASPFSGTRGLLVGVSPTATPALSDLQAFNALIAPRQADIALYFSNFPSDPVGFGSWWTDTASVGMMPMVAWQPNAATLGSITSGSQDAALAAGVARVQQATGQVLIRLAHEFNLSGKSYGNGAETAASFIAGWQYVVNYFRAHGATNVQWVWNANAFPDSVDVDPTSWYPGDAYVDIVGLDVYIFSTTPQIGGVDPTFEQLALSNYQTIVAAAPSKPFMFCEVGADSSRSGWTSAIKAAWISAAFDVIRREMPNCIALGWWNRSTEALTSPDTGPAVAFTNAVTSGAMAPSKPLGQYAPLTAARRVTSILGGPGGSSASLTAGNELQSRWKTALPVTPTRFRLRVRNYSRANLAAGGAITLTFASIGTPAYPTAAGDNRWLGLLTAAATQIASAVALDGTATDQFTPWITNTGQIAAHQAFVICAGFINSGGSSATIYKDFEGGWVFIGAGSSTQANVLAAALPPGGSANSPYIDVRLEYEYVTSLDGAGNPKVPTVLGVGDSIMQGLTGDTSIGSSVQLGHDETWLGQAGLARKFTVVNLGIAQKKASDFVTNWTAYLAVADLTTTVPEAAVIALGVNDLSGGASVATLEANLVTIIGNLKTLGIKRIYLATMIPAGYPGALSLTSGATTSASAVVTVASTTDLFPKMPVSGTGIPASTAVLTVDSPTQFTMNANATATNTGLTITAGTAAYLTTAAAESGRLTVNEWISRRPLGIEGVWDLDAALALQSRPGLAAPDMVSVYPHPDLRGYARMAEAVKI
jgi:lysophospholipase L1-like esterase